MYKIVEVLELENSDKVCSGCVFYNKECNECLLDLIEDYFHISIDSTCVLKKNIVYQIKEKDNV